MSSTDPPGRARRDPPAPGSAVVADLRCHHLRARAREHDRARRRLSPVPDRAPGSTGDPVLIEDRPHRDLIFPITGAEALARVRRLPVEHRADLTHLWLRWRGPHQQRPWASYRWGPGYRMIILYPWPRSLRWWLGRPPSSRWRRLAARFGAELGRSRSWWFVQFTLDGARRLFLDDLILHEVGHHTDWRPASPANHEATEEYADQHARTWARRLALEDQAATRARSPTGPRLTRADRDHLEATLAAAYPWFSARIERDRRDGPTPALTVSFRLLDRRGRARSNTAWIEPAAVAGLTVDGARERIARANHGWTPPIWSLPRRAHG